MSESIVGTLDCGNQKSSQFSGEGLVQQRLLQRRKQGVLPGVDGGEALGGDGGSPNGANHLSPGQRPGNRHEIHQALKGRFNPTYTVRRR